MVALKDSGMPDCDWMDYIFPNEFLGTGGIFFTPIKDEHLNISDIYYFSLKKYLVNSNFSLLNC